MTDTNNQRFVDADYTIKALSIFGDKKNGNQHFLNGIETAKEVINNQRSADVVEVVRCKDCRHRQKDVGMGDHRWCDIVNGSRCSNDFCSKGDRI